MKFRVILADPPWKYADFGHANNGAARNHYPLMTQERLCALPVAKLAADPCALFLWATGPKMIEALEVVDAWGFDFKTVAFTWHKTGNIGLGSYTRTSEEFVLLGTRPRQNHGLTKLLRSHSVRSFVEASRGEHSEKPEQVARRIEDLFPGPYLELFARKTRPGWSVFGNALPNGGDSCVVDVLCV